MEEGEGISKKKIESLIWPPSLPPPLFGTLSGIPTPPTHRHFYNRPAEQVSEVDSCWEGQPCLLCSSAFIRSSFPSNGRPFTTTNQKPPRYMLTIHYFVWQIKKSYLIQSPIAITEQIWLYRVICGTTRFCFLARLKCYSYTWGIPKQVNTFPEILAQIVWSIIHLLIYKNL